MHSLRVRNFAVAAFTYYSFVDDTKRKKILFQCFRFARRNLKHRMRLRFLKTEKKKKWTKIVLVYHQTIPCIFIPRAKKARHNDVLSTFLISRTKAAQT